MTKADAKILLRLIRGTITTPRGFREARAAIKRLQKVAGEKTP